jgi:hypothetical protein
LEQHHYIVRCINFDFLPFSMVAYVDQEIKLGDGVLGVGEGDNTIALPDPCLCNLKLNVIRVLHASGAVDIFRKYFEDSDSADMRSFVLGASVEMDNILLAKLQLIAV